MEQKGEVYFKREAWINKLEVVMLGLALVAVLIYMLELIGYWKSLGLESMYYKVSIGIDSIFVANLILKILALGRYYLTSPWFIVDFVSSLPILASVAALPNSLRALSFVRGFRLLRALRALRMINMLPILGVQDKTPVLTTEVKRLTKAMWIILPLYVVIFVSIVNHIYKEYPEQASLIEFFLILGSLIGLTSAIAIIRYQIPAILSVQVNKLLNIALPSQVANYFIKHPEAYNHMVMMPASIIFCDIKNFTNTVEEMANDYDTLKSNLELVMTAVTEIHIKYDLIIDKFIGDAIMSFRGGDLVSGTPEIHAWCVVKSALETLKVIRAMKNPYFHDMKIGGASMEIALIGPFGTPSRLSYTILGDRVNLAARLESAVKQYGTDNLFCDRTYALLKNHKEFTWRRFGKIKVEGKNESLDIYEVFDAEKFEDTKWIDQFHLSVQKFEEKKFEEALEGFTLASKMRLDTIDIPCERYIKCCKRLIASPLDKDWSPVFIPFK